MSQQNIPRRTAVGVYSQRPSDFRPRKVGPSAGVKLLPHAQTDDDRKPSAAKDISDTEDDEVASPLASSGNRPAENPAEGDPSSWLTKVLAFLKTFPSTVVARTLAHGLSIALPCSAAFFILGALFLNHVFHIAPSPTISIRTDLSAWLAGSLVAVAAAMGVTAFVLSRLHGMDLEKISGCLDEMEGIVGLLASVFAMPLGSAIMSLFGWETFGVWHALVVTATGLSVLVGLFFSTLILVLVVVSL